jgi:hypothetical protein
MSFMNVGFAGTVLAAALELATHTDKATTSSPAAFQDDIIQKK